MNENLLVDGIDVFVRYGVFILEGGYNDLVSAPNLKELKINDWQEENGVEADLSNPILDTKEFTILFGSINSSQINDFIALLSDRAYHSFNFKRIGAIRRLRLVSQSNKNTVGHLEKFSLQFADDFPLDDYTYDSPINPIPQSGFNIDNIPLANYGVWVLEDSYDEIMKMPAIKKNLQINYRNKAGLIYQDKSVKFQSKEVALKCCLRANSTAVFWRNYHALIYDLTRPDERQFYVKEANETYSCFYKGISVAEFTIINKDVWCEFTLTLVFTYSKLKAI